MRILLAFVLFFVTNVSHADISDMFKNLGVLLEQDLVKDGNEADSISTIDNVEMGPDGIAVGCNSIKDNVSNDQLNVKSSEWTQEVVDFLKRKVETCAEQKNAVIHPGKYPVLTDTEKTIVALVNQSIDSKYAYVLAQREAKHKEAETLEKMKAAAQCKQTDIYNLYENQNEVVNYQEMINSFRIIQKKEREVDMESGVRNLKQERALAARIVLLRDLRDAHFKEYKRYGGTATVAEKVMSEKKDPCFNNI